MVEIVVAAPGQLTLRPDANPPPPGRDEVVLRVERAGICGSDIHILHGSNPFARYPRIIGHEFAGEVAAIGDAVEGLVPGETVVIDPVLPCGHCYPCRIGRPNVCANLQVLGVHRDGGFRRHATVPARCCVKVPDGLALDIATLAEPFAVAANVLSRAGIEEEDTVLIYGAGTVGLTVLQVAKLHGARCLVSDPDTARLERAKAFGADRVIDPRHETVPDAVRAEHECLGPSLIIDGAGIPALLAEACAVASPAARIGLLGFSATPSTVVQQQIVGKELSLVGSRLNRGFVAQAVAWLAEGRLKPAAMITHSFAASDARAAFDLIERDPASTIKVQLDFNA